jgi:hypothetical protein
MPEPVASWLEARLREAKCFLEYGSGGSTLLAASLGVPVIVSVESDPVFGSSVVAAVESSGSKSQLKLISANIGPTRKWGFPATFQEYRRWPDYALQPWDHVRENGLSPDLVLIDGRFRVGCFFATLLDAAPGTAILFDDYLLRTEVYGYVEAILPPSEIIEGAAVFVVPKARRQLEIARALARYIMNPE